MKSIQTRTLLAAISLVSAIALPLKPASAQIGTNPWNGNVVLVSLP